MGQLYHYRNASEATLMGVVHWLNESDVNGKYNLE